MNTNFEQLTEVLVSVTVYDGDLIDWQGDGFYIRRMVARWVYEWQIVQHLIDLIDAEVNADRYQYITNEDIETVLE